MKKLILAPTWLIAIAIAVVLGFGFASFSQRAEAQSSESASVDVIGRLFLTLTERRVLEAIRQGMIEQPSITLGTELPGLDIPSVGVIEPKIRKTSFDTSVDTYERSVDLHLKWFIRNRSSNDLVIGLGDRVLHSEDFGALKNAGLEIGESDNPAVIEFQDHLFNARVKAYRGTKILSEGGLEYNARVPNHRRFVIYRH